jgi:sugar/nucleoside kinase (ribokinase family)
MTSVKPGAIRRILENPGTATIADDGDIIPGGTVGTASRWLAGLGARVLAAGCVGNDDLGHLLNRKLKDAGVETALQFHPSFKTSFSVVLADATFDRSFIHYLGANAAFDLEKIGPYDCNRAILIGYPPLLPQLRMHGLAAVSSRKACSSRPFVAVDFSYDRDGLDSVDWNLWVENAATTCSLISFSQADAAALLRWPSDSEGPNGLQKDWLNRLHQRGLTYFHLKMGRRGAWLSVGSTERGTARLLRCEAPEVQATVTSGAGDIAFAQLAFDLSQGEAPERALRASIAAASASTTRLDSADQR